MSILKGVAIKKPIPTNFVRLTNTTIKDCYEFVHGKELQISTFEEKYWWDYEDIVRDKGLTIPTLEGEMTAYLGDYILEGVEGEHWPVKSDIFEKTYKIME